MTISLWYRTKKSKELHVKGVSPCSIQTLLQICNSRIYIRDESGSWRNTSSMKHKLVVTHKYTILQGEERIWHVLNRPILKHVMSCFHENIRKCNFFCGYIILTESVVVTQLSSNVGISVWENCVCYDKFIFYERLICRKNNWVEKNCSQ